MPPAPKRTTPNHAAHPPAAARCHPRGSVVNVVCRGPTRPLIEILQELIVQLRKPKPLSEDLPVRLDDRFAPGSLLQIVLKR